MKKTCKNCKALNEGCILGFKTKIIKIPFGNIYLNGYKPNEKCPKPKTYKELNNLLGD